MRILVTAIGSMSAECVISSLNRLGYDVFGCDIYPSEWHYISKKCIKVYQSPLACLQKEYIDFLLYIIKKEKITYLLPLTDIEIDIIDAHRSLFEQHNIQVCMPKSSVLDIVRNKYKLWQFFEKDKNVPSIRTIHYDSDHRKNLTYPCIAKPVNGRSSEGILYLENDQHLCLIKGREYIIQEIIKGPVFTVDYVRSELFKTDYSVPREELLRTKNGAGLTVRIKNDLKLRTLVSYIGNKLNINGCINMEFIYHNDQYYLIDINPRFSAGIAFTAQINYNMIESHMNCHSKKEIVPPIDFPDQIITKRYQEEILKIG
ncbi:MAG: ATP-grasp domain-containing protein [Bacteroidales bacterium]